LNNRVHSEEMTVRKDCSGNKPFSGKQGFGSWNKNGMGNYEEHKFQQKGWDATKHSMEGVVQVEETGEAVAEEVETNLSFDTTHRVRMFRSYANAIKFEVFIVEG